MLGTEVGHTLGSDDRNTEGFDDGDMLGTVDDCVGIDEGKLVGGDDGEADGTIVGLDDDGTTDGTELGVVL